MRKECSFNFLFIFVPISDQAYSTVLCAYAGPAFVKGFFVAGALSSPSPENVWFAGLLGLSAVTPLATRYYLPSVSTQEVFSSKRMSSQSYLLEPLRLWCQVVTMFGRPFDCVGTFIGALFGGCVGSIVGRLATAPGLLPHVPNVAFHKLFDLRNRSIGPMEANKPISIPFDSTLGRVLRECEVVFPPRNVV